VADPEVRREVEATIEARRELGPEHEEALVAAFLDRLERTLDERVAKPAKSAKAPAAQQAAQRFVVAMVSLGCGIPITAIAGDHGLAGILIAWAGIVGVNVAMARQ
jgi:hypothetical protein